MPFGPIIRSMTRNKTRFGLIILEIAITLAIVTNCVNMILAERAKMEKRSGFDDANLMWVRLRPFTPDFRESKFIEQTVDADLRALKTVPGVKSVANTNFLPWQGGGSSTTVKIAGVKSDVVRTQIYYGTPETFETLGVKIGQGRNFVMQDYDYPEDKEPKVVIISRALANLMFKDGQALGQAIQNSDAGGTNVTEPFTVVGIIEEFYNPYGWPIHEYVVFGPSRVGSYNRGLRYLVRAEPGATKAVAGEMEKRLLAVNSGRAFEMKTIADVKDQYFAGGRLLVTAMTAVIVVLVFVTALGIIGITSLAVAERTRQIGTRRALGATRADILKHFLLENWIVTTAGLLLGVVAAYGLNFLLVSKISDVKLDWYLVAIGMVLLWVNGLLATLPPALRGSVVSPAIATRAV